MEASMDNSIIEKCVVCGADVFSGKDLIPQILPRLRSVFEEGALCVVYEKEYEDVATALCQELKRGGYRVFLTNAYQGKIQDVPEYARYVFAVGAHDAAEKAKEISTSIDTGWSMLFCAPDSDDITCGKCPNQVFIDENILIKCKNEQIAAGYGILLSQKFAEFERAFQKTVLGEKVKQFAVETSSCPLSELAYRLIEISSRKQGKDTAERMAEVMSALALSKGKTPRLTGEYRFLASAVLTSFYSAYLSSPSIDCAPPACVFDSVDKLQSLGIEVDRGEVVDFFDINGYFRIGYILGEYRLDLLEKLASIDLHGMQRFWRRLYIDAGYWLKSEITASEVLECMRLASVESRSLAGYAFASGMLDIAAS